MTPIARLLAAAAMLLSPLCAHALESTPATTQRDTATLVSERDGNAPGQKLRLGLHLRMAPGWHTYWSNPGDAGAPPTIDITGAHGGPIAYPAPQHLTDGPFTSFAYTGDLLLPVTLEAPKAGPLSIDAHATWLICEKVCVPEEAQFHLDIQAANGPAALSAEAPLFAAADARTPRASPFPAHIAPDGTLWLADMTLPVRNAYFFPDTAGVIDQGFAQHAATRSGRLEIPLKPLQKTLPALSGVLALTDSGGETALLQIAATPLAIPGNAVAHAPTHTSTGLLEALLLAFAGGLILNLMPCVLPVLAMKAMAVARLSGAAKSHVRREAGFYTLGVLTAFCAIGAATLGARALGGAAGWGVQFQSAAFTTAMAWLLFGIGLNMSGVFEVGASLAGTGDSLARRGSFFTGLLAVVVATPCTAPFMGAALAAAIALPAAYGMLIFVALGLGLAAPYALLALSPGLARLLPRPGAWMDLFRSLLAFPMYAASLWMLWVVSQQAGPGGLVAVLAGFLLLGFAAWGIGYGQAHEGFRPLRIGVLASLAGAAAVLASLAISPPPASATALAAQSGTEPFSPTHLAALRAEHHAVLVDMSAAWCVSCLVNERVALSPQAVRDAFARHHVILMRGDWTRQDAAITTFLQHYDRSGVPLYVFFAADGTETVLPQLLTQAEVLSHVERAGS